VKRSPFDELIDRGVTAHQAGQLDKALSAYRAALRLAPKAPEALSLLGLALTHAGRLNEAESPLRRAVEHEPDQSGFRLNLVELLEATRHYEAARRQLDEVTTRTPDLARGWEKSGDIHVVLGDTQRAAADYQRALSLDPKSSTLAYKLARAHLALGALADAAQACELAAHARPGTMEVLQLRADILIAQRDWKELESFAQMWTNLHPNDAPAWQGLSQAFFQQGRYGASMDAFRHVLEHAPGNAGYLVSFGRICMQALDFDAAAAALNQAEAIARDAPEIMTAKGLLLTYLGRLEEAQKYARRCAARHPDHVPAYGLLSRLGHGRLPDDAMERLGRLVEQDTLPMEHRIRGAFALADAHDARGDVALAFAGWERANTMSRELATANDNAYDPARAEARTERLMRLFAGAPGPLDALVEGPHLIFIVGVPRSGTTLVEAMLSAHSRVFAGGERPAMPRLLEAYLAGAGSDEEYSPTDAQFTEWAAVYLRELPPLSGADYLTDKYPLNFEAVGLIARLFPAATILHVRRNPLETGLSVFAHEFAHAWPFAHRLEDIGHFYGQYAALAAHWQQVLGKRFVTIRYEELTARFEPGAKRVVETCGLDWEPQCLDFQTAARAIATPSAVQARQPVITRAGRAERYREFLAPLVQALEAAHVDLDTGALRNNPQDASPNTWQRLKKLFRIPD